MADYKKLGKVADIEMASAFELNAGKLIQMLGTAEPIRANAGETLKQYKIAGTLSKESYTEGSDIPLSTYTKEVVQTYEITLKPYRKQTTLQKIQKRGYSEAVDETDRKMLADIQMEIKKGIVTALGTGTATATGTDFVSAAANAWATLQNKVEEYGYGDVTPVFFANPVDFAACVGKSEVFSAFGMPYIENWAGLGTLISTSAVTANTIYCAAAENLKVYYIDANEAPGFEFTTDESGYIAVAHSAGMKSLTYDTVAWTALTIFPEYTDFIVKSTISEAAA